MTNKKYQLGLVGLGVMGRNLLLNMADSGYAVAGYDKDPSKVDALAQEAQKHEILGAREIGEFTGALQSPKAILLLVPAGKIVDAVIADLLPYLDKGDLIIDGGNSYFADTDRRYQSLAAQGIHFMGMGVSGGAEGARLGPSMMPGGNREAFETVRPILESVAAHVNGDPCVAFVGNGSAGHYVKMVHNGIEYGMMELIAEVYDLMKRGLGLDNAAIAAVFEQWNRGKLASFLVEITAAIFTKLDDKTGRHLIDLIQDASRQKGTGKWTSQDAMNLQAAIPVIDMAVVMRDLSGYKAEREAAEKILGGAVKMPVEDSKAFISTLENALYFSFLAAYAQGFNHLRKASAEYGFDLQPATIAKIWRGGCIIRAALLETFMKAFQRNPDLPNLLVDPEVAKAALSVQRDARSVIKAALDAGIPVAGLSAAVAYFDAYRSERLPANLIQAQRDFFGSHTYERVDMAGTFHTEW